MPNRQDLITPIKTPAEVTEDQRSYMVQQNTQRKTTQTQLHQHQNQPTTTTKK
jgi:hypothetical protein